MIFPQVMSRVWTKHGQLAFFWFFLKIIFDIGPKGKLGVKETRADKLD